MKDIAVVTVARSDYGIYFPLLQAIERHADLQLKVIVSGMHLSPEFGMTVEEVEKDFKDHERVESLHYADGPEGVGQTIASGVSGFTRLFSRYRPDILVVLGDRFDMLPAALAALPFKIPLAHLHGGELTLGNIDDAIRHTITKLAHIHFAGTETYARRICQLGEEPWRVHVAGAVGLDAIRSAKLWSREETGNKLGFDSSRPYLLSTFHPETLNCEKTGYYINQLLAAFSDIESPVVFTCANADPSGKLINEAIARYAGHHENAWVVANAGRAGYYSLMAHAAAMVGNSSSGIIEAASFGLPVVNIGARQNGRVKPRNVIDCGHTKDEIKTAVAQAAAEDFKAGLAGMNNPYGDGKSAARIVNVLSSVALNDRLIIKKFHDIDVENHFKEPWT